ncbi:hypothetical protein FQR65_LT13279 [Abscondita terminalis]|nr:hypothetical protein FQR65_LT13279 [Abscondita terminalis]
MKPEMALKDALLEIISCMLSPNTDLRGVAEERKKALEVTEEYAIHLADILLTAEEALEERQMAGILLKQYIRNHWTDADEFVPPATSDLVKQKLRISLPNGLCDTIGKIRNTSAIILVHIARCDYPYKWPEMINDILLMLEPGDENTCSGILSFISDFSRLATCSQICESTEKIYPFLYTIGQGIKYSTHIRAKAILQFANFPCELSMVKDEKGAITNTVTNFCLMCSMQLTLPHPEQSDYILKSQILKAYSLLLNKMPPTIIKPIVDVLPTIWQILFRCGIIFDDMLVKETLPYRDPGECLDDPPLFYTLVYNVFEVLHTILTIESNLPEVLAVLSDLVYHTILFMAIPQDTEDRWKHDPDVYFSEDVNEDCVSSSVRIQAKQFLTFLIHKINRVTITNALTEAVEKHLTLSKLKSESYYWRIMEATIYAVGAIKSFVVNLYQTKQLQNFNIINYLNQWAAELGPCPAWLMLARIMWIGGRYALLLRSNIVSTYVMSIVHNLGEPSFILRYSAIRSILLHLITVSESEHKFVYVELRYTLAHALIDALDHLQGDILHIGLYALEKLLKLEPPFIESIQNELITLVLNIFARNISSLKIVKSLHPIIKEICIDSNCQKNFENKFLPILTNVLNQVISTDQTQLTSFEAQRNAIEVLNTLVKYSYEPISDNLITYGFICLSNCIITVDDSAITQCGADCLRSYLCKGTSNILEFRDNEGRSGTDYILNVLKYVLDPHKMEFACKQVGRFFITAMHTLGPQLDQHFSFLLRGVLSSMQRAKTIPVEESLLIIFAYLFYYHLEAVINYLTLIPGPDGRSALAFVLDRWLLKNYIYGGKYQFNLNVLALTRLIEHTFIHEDERVADIKVKEYAEFEDDEYSDYHNPGFLNEIPILLKIIKHLLLYSSVLKRILHFLLFHSVLALTRLIEHTFIHEDERVADIKVKEYAEFEDDEYSDYHNPGFLNEIPILLKIIKHLLYIVQFLSVSMCQNEMVSESTQDTESPISKHQRNVKSYCGSYTSQTSLWSDSENESDDSGDMINETPDPLDATDPIYNVKITEYLTNFLKNCSGNEYFRSYIQFLNNNEKKFLSKIGVSVSRFSKP